MSGKATLFFDRIAWRPVILVSIAILFFGAFLRQTGLLLAVFLTSFVCALADDEAKPAKAVIVSACLAVLCTLLFIYAVRLPLPVFGAWFVAG